MMKNITISIEGEFWDYLIKYNELILWTYDGEIKFYNWELLIEDLARNKNAPEIYRVFQNSAIEKYNFLLQHSNSFNEYDEFREMEISISQFDLNKYLLRTLEIPFQSLSISIDSYNNSLFVNTDEGLYTLDRMDFKNKRKIWDSPLYDIEVGKYGRLAMSAGEDGVFEYRRSDMPINKDLRKDEIGQSIYLLSTKHSNTVNWINNNIYSSSSLKDAFMVNTYNQHQDKLYDDEIIEESKIFKSYKKRLQDISWSGNNKFYRVYENNRLEVVSIERKENEIVNFKSRDIKFSTWKGDVISGSSAKFGTVVECENALVILFDDGSFLNIPGDIIRWKTYDRYHRYNNLLGIIFEDKVVFKAFTFNTKPNV